MIQTSINLPTKYRLHLQLVKRRKSFDNPLLPNLGKIRRVRKGSKVSRFFRHMFEHEKIRKILGANLALMIISTSFLPQNSAEIVETEENTTAEAPIVLTTQRSTQYPVENVIISQGYKFYHPGIDLDGITGDFVYPIMDGKVEAVGYSKIGYGNAIYITHKNNISSLYAHFYKIEVKKGQEVTTKTKIGELGATGRASGDHLHLEIHQNGVPVNPLTVLP